MKASIVDLRYKTNDILKALIEMRVSPFSIMGKFEV